MLDTVGKRVRDARYKKGYSLEDLAKLVGLSHKSLVSKIELDRVGISAKKLPLFCSALDVTPDYLLYGKKEDNTNDTNNTEKLKKEITEDIKQQIFKELSIKENTNNFTSKEFFIPGVDLDDLTDKEINLLQIKIKEFVEEIKKNRNK